MTQKTVRQKLKIGDFRPLLLFGGPGYEKLLREKFRAELINREIMSGVYAPEGLDRALETNGNHIFLAFDFGRPEDEAQEEWDAFAKAAQVVRDAGMYAIASMRPCDYAASGAFAAKGWAAQTARGRRQPAEAPGRFRACVIDPEWVERAMALTDKAFELGADGVYLDNLAFGAFPTYTAGSWFGPAGCHCKRCRAAFREAGGAEARAIPKDVDNGDDPAVRAFLEWRAGRLTEFVAALAARAREKSPDAIVAGNVPFAMQANVFLQAGADLKGLAGHLDALATQNFQLSFLDKKGLIYDAPTFMTLCPSAPDTLVVNSPDWHVAGFNAQYTPERYKVMLAESASNGGATLIKGSGARDLKGHHWTFFTEEGKKELCGQIGEFYRWINENAELYKGIEPAATVGLVCPEEALKWRWAEAAPSYFKLAQTFLELHILFRVVPESRPDLMEGLELLALPNVRESDLSGNLISRLKTFIEEKPVFWTGEAPMWAMSSDNLTLFDAEIFAESHSGAVKTLGGGPAGRPFVAGALGLVNRSYFRSGPFRAIADSMDLYSGTIQRPLRYTVPKEWKKIYDPIMKALKKTPGHIHVEGPAFMHVQPWRKGDQMWLHIVNHMPDFPDMNAISITFPKSASGKLLTADDNKIRYFQNQSRLAFNPKVYTIVELRGL